MDIIAAYREAGTYRGAASIAGTTHKTAKQAWRRDHHWGRRPAVWSPGEHLVIDWGALDGLHVFCERGGRGVVR